MTRLRPLACIGMIAALCAVFAGCQTTPKAPAKPVPSRAGEAEMKKLTVSGVKLGDPITVVRKFPNAKKVTSSIPGVQAYEVYRPNQHISMMLLFFREGRLWKIELRYFNGPTERTLAATGGWNGLRDILIKRFGPPVKTGPDVPQLNTLRGLSSRYARFNGVWDFPHIYRQIHYITLSDSKGGVAIVTFLDSSPRATGTTAEYVEGAPNPGF